MVVNAVGASGAGSPTAGPGGDERPGVLLNEDTIIDVSSNFDVFGLLFLRLRRVDGLAPLAGRGGRLEVDRIIGDAEDPAAIRAAMPARPSCARKSR